MNLREISTQLLHNTQRIDLQLQSLWAVHGASNALTSCALAAVGGYGRGEMYPQSDVDLLIIHPQTDSNLATSSATLTAIEAFITALWDTGLHIGHSVRSLEECVSEAASDITVQTAMLEARYLAGDAVLFTKMHNQFFSLLNPAAFLQAKVLEMQQRHQRYENTPYSLEPNCKESPGGLRDLHLVLWIARAAGLLGNYDNDNDNDKTSAVKKLRNQSPPSSWKTLQTQGVLSATEYRSLTHAEHIVQTIRHALHTLAKRCEDRLVFDLQSQVAQTLGFEAKPGRRASEMLMQQYYLAAKAISQLSGLLLQALERRILGEASYQQVPLVEGYCEQNGFLHALDLNAFERDPVEILKVFHVLAKHPHLRDLSADTERAVWNARDGLAKVRGTSEFKTEFMRFFYQGAGLTRSFRRMNALGILGRALPAFRRIVGQMQHDLFHVYTVDQHILTVLRNMRRFAMPQHVHEYPLCSQLLAGFEPEYVLYIAALFHDIAKGRGGDHSDLGQNDVRRFGQSMGMPTADTELAVFLVKQHLMMSTVAQKSDLSDPNTIAKFALLVGTEQRLTALYLLTVADIRGTSPKVWNAWKGKLLESLYHQTLRHLRGNSSNASTATSASNVALENPALHAQNVVRALLSADIIPKPLWDTLDDAYFLRNAPEDAAWHTQMLLPNLTQSVSVASRSAPDETGLQVLVYASDQAELFARICSCFDVQGLAVLDAQVYTTRTGQALDHFLLAMPEQDPGEESNSALALQVLQRLEHHLKQSLSTQPPLPAPRSARLPRQARHFAFAPQCHLSLDEKGSNYLLEIQAVDQPSLLYRVAKVFSEHHIAVHTARITTLGGRAEDFFLISGEALNSTKQQLALETALISVLQVQ
jgi:[protein-PII] uridylyltransferase